MFSACDDQMVGKCLRGDENDLESIAADVEDDDMLLPCLEVTLKVPTPARILVNYSQQKRIVITPL